MLSAKKDANECLTRFATLTNELLSSFLEMDDPEYAGRSSEQIMREIVETDTKLQSVVQQLSEEYTFYTKCAALKKRTEEHERQIFRFTSRLKKADEALRNMLDSSAGSLESMQLARNNMVEIEDIIGYGHRISRTMCEMQFENQKLSFLLPYPSLSQLQETRLFFSDGVAGIVQPTVEASSTFEEENRFLEIAQTQGVVPIEIETEEDFGL